MSFTMKVVVPLAVVLFASRFHATTGVSTWTDVFDGLLFGRLVTLATDRRADIYLPQRCLSDYGSVNVRRLSRHLPFPVRIYTEASYCHRSNKCIPLSLDATSVALILCKDDGIVRALVQLPYKQFVALLSDDVRADMLTLENATSLRNDSYEYLKYRDVCSVYRDHSAVMLARDDRQECLSCEESPAREGGYPRLLEQLPLNGSRLRVICFYPVLCEHPTYAVLLDVLNHKKASVRQKQYSAYEFRKMHYTSTRSIRANEIVLKLQEWPVMDLEFPRMVRPCHYHTVAFTRFGKRRYPLPKEIVLILPFSWHVWVAILAAMALGSLVLFLVLRASGSGTWNAYKALFALVASLLQQSDQLSYTQQRRFPARLLLTLWSVMSLVLSTVYKGSLTALLRDVPLEADHPEFSNIWSIYMQGSILRQLEFTELRGDTSEENAKGIIDAEYLAARGRYITPDKKFFPLTYQFMGPHTSSIHRELLKFDYVPTGQPFKEELVGTQITYASPFRKALARSIGSAQECGLFSRAEALKEFEVKYRSHNAVVSSAPEVLSLSDLKPFFLIWSVGLGAAVVVLLLERMAAWLCSKCAQGGSFRRRIRRELVTRRWFYDQRSHFRFPDFSSRIIPGESIIKEPPTALTTLPAVDAK